MCRGLNRGRCVVGVCVLVFGGFVFVGGWTNEEDGYAGVCVVRGIRAEERCSAAVVAVVVHTMEGMWSWC